MNNQATVSVRPTPATKVIGVPNSHDAIRRWLSLHEPCKILDAPAGEGILAAYLLERGWEVHCADIDAGNFKLDRQKIEFKAADLNRELPYEDESFDIVACVNGLHRLYNPGGAVSEFHRVLRPGGTLLINVNNYASLAQRLRFLLFGSLSNTSPAQQTIAAPEAHIRQALMFPQIATAIEATGLQLIGVRPAAPRALHRFLTPIGWLVRVAGRVAGHANRSNLFLKFTNSHSILTAGSYLLIEARKPA